MSADLFADISNLDLDLLLVDKTKEFNLTKDTFASAIESIMEDTPLPPLIFHTLQKIYENYRPLHDFLAKVFGTFRVV